MSKKDQIREEILRRLLTARYRFGEPISVKDIVEETGFSRQPIMTAMNGLAADGFVTIVAQVGCAVATPSVEEIEDFYLMFARLEGLMGELAARRRSDEQLRRLTAINRSISDISPSHPDAAEVYRSLNLDFHHTIHAMARSALLSERQSNVFALSDFFIAQTLGFMPHLHEAADEHEAIISAISDQDPAAAGLACEGHISAVGAIVSERARALMAS